MKFEELEKICSLLWGQSWQSELARGFNIDRRTVSKWKSQGVAKWVDPRLKDIVDKRVDEVMHAAYLHKNLSLDDTQNKQDN